MGTDKPKQINFNTLVSFIILGVLAWAGSTLQNVSRKVDVLEVRFADYQQAASDRLSVIRADVARHEVLIDELKTDMSKIRRAAPPKQQTQQ